MEGGGREEGMEGEWEGEREGGMEVGRNNQPIKNIA